jgi:prevent-host-death family protein
MNLTDDIRPISYIKTHAADMLKQINDTQHPIVITQNGKARGVLLDTKSYQEMVDAIGILKLLTQSERSIEDGGTLSHKNAIRSAKTTVKDK